MTHSNLPLRASNLQILQALIIKDVRFFRVPFIGSIVVGLGCYLLSIVSTFGIYSLRGEDTAGAGFGAGITLVSNQCAIALTIVIASAFAGLSLAADRSDRTADFIAMLPISRAQIVFSKWVVILSMVFLCLGFHLIVLLAIWHLDGRPPALDTVFFSGALTMMLGVGGLFSTFSRSGTISACIAIGLTVALMIAVELLGSPKWPRDTTAGIAAAAVGICSVIAGTIYYLRRIEP